MRRKIILNCRTSEKRAALIEDDKLVEILIESPNHNSIVGNIYKGRVVKVVPGMQAAFIDIGHERNGFLQLDQLLAYKNMVPSMKGKATISHLIHEGEEILVQVLKDEFGEKGPRLTNLIELQGRFLIFLPYDGQVSVSRKMSDTEREQWKSVGQEWCEETEGIIFRTACARKEKEMVQKEYQFLKRKWDELLKTQATGKVPCLIYNHASLVERFIRDFIDDSESVIIIDDAPTYRIVKERLSLYAVHIVYTVEFFKNKEDIFSYFAIEQEMERLMNPIVELENGASLVIQHTEALTVIDVNSGKFTGKQHVRDTILKTNEVAAMEIARQLRLRNIGGMIVIDFINMQQKKDQEYIQRQFVAALTADRTYTKVYDFTQLGLLEMTRKKERKSLPEQLMAPCPTCHGKGKVISSEQIALRLERTLLEHKGMDQEAIWVEVPVKVLEIWKEQAQFRMLEEMLGFTIFMTSTEKLMDTFEVRQIGSVPDIKERIQK